MAKWTIVVQEESAGKVKTPVLCKWVKFFPQMKNRVRVGFGIFKFIVLKVVIQAECGAQHVVTWSDVADDGEGRWKYKWPSKMDHDYERCIETNRPIKDKKGNFIKDYLVPMVEYKGPEEGFANEIEMATFLVKQVGVEMASEIMQLFAEKLVIVRKKRAEAAAKKAAA